MGVLKDSGERRQFSSGGVRDMHAGKGRMDLIPMDIFSRFFQFDADYSLNRYDYTTGEEAFDSLLTSKIFDACQRFLRKQQVDILAFVEIISAIAHVHYSSIYGMVLEISKHFENGAEKYGVDNWRKGLPLSCYLDSGIRHWCKYKDGQDDEPHLTACVWNFLCFIATFTMILSGDVGVSMLPHDLWCRNKSSDMVTVFTVRAESFKVLGLPPLPEEDCWEFIDSTPASPALYQFAVRFLTDADGKVEGTFTPIISLEHKKNAAYLPQADSSPMNLSQMF